MLHIISNKKKMFVLEELNSPKYEKERKRLIELLESKSMLKLCIETNNSTVFKCTESNKIVKVIPCKNFDARKQIAMNEVYIYEELKKRKVNNIPIVYGSIPLDNMVIQVIENAGMDGLYLCNSRCITRDLHFDAIIEFVSTVNQLHSHEIFHRDIKLDNIGYNKDTNKWKLFDFGLSLFQNTNNITITGTLPYIAPEFSCSLKRPSCNIESLKRADYYGMALTLLSLVYPYFSYHCEGCKLKSNSCNHNDHEAYYTRLHLKEIYDLKGYTSSFLEHGKYFSILMLLRDIVLHDYILEYQYIMWNKKKGIYQYDNKIEKMTIEKKTVEECWQEIVNKISTEHK